MAVMVMLSLLAKYAALILSVYCIVVGTYRVFFHSLRNYPGPIIAKVSDLYAGFFALGMSLHLTTYADLKIYGSVMRHGPNKLVFNSAAALRDIYNNERFNKSHVYLLTVNAGKASIFNTLEKQRHRNKRKVIGQAITEKAMRDFEPTMGGQIDIFIELLSNAARTSTSVNITEYTKRLGMDIVGLLAFGYTLNLQTHSTNRFMLRGIAVGTYQNNAFMQFPPLKHLGLHRLLGLVAYKQRRKYLHILQEMIRARLSEPIHAKHDLYSFVADHLDDNADGLHIHEIWSEALFFFPAGGDTTTTAISALFFYLAHSQDVYRKLATEVRLQFKHYSDIKGGQRLSSCRYLRACIDEALRMSPPVTGTLWRDSHGDSDNQGPVIVDGHAVPPGTQVGVSIYSLHHNESYFPRPFDFDPDRWLVDDEAALSRMHAAFCPFSLGARGCAGKAMAYLEASLVLAKTIWLYDFELAPGELGKVGEGSPLKGGGRARQTEFQLYDTFGSRHDGPNLVFHARVGVPSDKHK